MSRLPLLGGAYEARSIIASCQRCINYFPEKNPEDSLTKLTHYQRPGFRLLAQGPVAPVRGIWKASNGAGYCVIGSGFYSVNLITWALTKLGDLLAVGRTNPCSFIDNGTTGLLVDGSSDGYFVSLATGAFAKVVDPTGAFQGATRVDTIDTFVIGNYPGTFSWWSSLSATTSGGDIDFDPTYVASKANYPDLLQTLFVNRHEILLFGTQKSEIWFDAGNATFPFAEVPGAYIEHGILAPYSIASADISVYLLSSDLQGNGMVLRQRAYETKRISTHAIEQAILQMAREGTITDAIGYCYQQAGHIFYVLSFPSGNQTWVFDESCELWHQRAWTDENGGLNRDRSNCCAVLGTTVVVGDHSNGKLYALDTDYYLDDGQPISFIRSFPHIGAGMRRGQLVENNGDRMSYKSFTADMECGAAADAAPISLRWSVDRGRTYGNAVLQTSGDLGQYTTQPNWNQLGQARDLVFEISHSINGPAALNGAWVDVEVLGS